MVNPSTADATENDATIRKLLGFGRHNEWGRIIVGNLFAYRTKDVRELGKVSDPVGPENDAHIVEIMLRANRVVVAWGPVTKQPKYLRGRWRRVIECARLARIGLLSIGEPAKCGHPKHPLMLSYELPIVPWSAPA